MENFSPLSSCNCWKRGELKPHSLSDCFLKGKVSARLESFAKKRIFYLISVTQINPTLYCSYHSALFWKGLPRAPGLGFGRAEEGLTGACPDTPMQEQVWARGIKNHLLIINKTHSNTKQIKPPRIFFFFLTFP
jgi:hypothetical protein